MEKVVPSLLSYSLGPYGNLFSERLPAGLFLQSLNPPLNVK
jgi:hypothetical protein